MSICSRQKTSTAQRAIMMCPANTNLATLRGRYTPIPSRPCRLRASRSESVSKIGAITCNRTQTTVPWNINGDSYKIQDGCYGEKNAWKVSYTEGEYKSLTITVDVSTSNRYVKITGVKNTGGAPLQLALQDSILPEINTVRRGTSTSTSCNATKISNTIFRSMPSMGQNGAMYKVILPEMALTIIISARLARRITWCI